MLINVCESARVIEAQVCAKCFWTIDRELEIDGMKLLNLKNDMSASIKPFD